MPRDAPVTTTRDPASFIAASLARRSTHRRHGRERAADSMPLQSRKGKLMAKYLFVASFTTDGVKGLIKSGGTARVAAVSKTVEGLGGTLESLYFAFGSDDVYATVDLPDNVSAAAIGLTVSASGFTRVKTVVLLTPAEVDQAAKKQVEYSPPGQ
jgi:uncharacterized protein with GYD domain